MRTSISLLLLILMLSFTLPLRYHYHGPARTLSTSPSASTLLCFRVQGEVRRPRDGIDTLMSHNRTLNKGPEMMLLLPIMYRWKGSAQRAQHVLRMPPMSHTNTKVPKDLLLYAVYPQVRSQTLCRQTLGATFRDSYALKSRRNLAN